MIIRKKLKSLLLHNRTQQEFGYNISELSRGSVRYIWHKCIICSRPKKTKFREFLQDKALSHQECKIEIRKRTNLQKYSVEHAPESKQVKKRIRQTWKGIYGVDNPRKAEQVKQKIRNTWKDKYGVDNPSRSERVQQKRKQNNLRKYGVKHSCGNLKHLLYSKQYWLKQKFHDNCKVNPNQSLPDQWSQGCSQKFEIICSCGKIFIPVFNDLTSGRSKSCGHFSQSQGEKRTGEYLTLLFPNQITTQDDLGFLKGQGARGGNLKVDFANRDLKFAVEYNGLQHDQPVEYFGGKEAFELQQKNDEKKEKLLKKYDWTLVRVRYDQSIKDQLIDALNNINFVIKL